MKESTGHAANEERVLSPKGTGDQLTDQRPKQGTVSVHPAVVRLPTDFARFPIHQLSDTHTIPINILERDGRGRVTRKWQVSPSDTYGEPRRLAAKIDSRIINRLVEERGRPVQRILRLGSLRDLAKRLKLGGDTDAVKKALTQNASAFITAKLTYVTQDGGEETLDARFTRYSFIFRDQKFPDGSTADMVYLFWNDPWFSVVNEAKTRPLDADYADTLGLSQERFYQILAPTIYGAVANGRAAAEIRYSDVCTWMPQTRYYDRKLMQKQMASLHQVHLKQGYLEKPIEYRRTADAEGKGDWSIAYCPGPRAKDEFKRFKSFPRKGRRDKASGEEAAPVLSFRAPEQPRDEAAESKPAADSPLIVELQQRGIGGQRARRILGRFPDERALRDRLEWADQRFRQQGSGVHNPAGFYVSILEDDAPPPETFESNSRRKQREDDQARRLKEEALREEQQQAYHEYVAGELDRYISEHQELYQQAIAAKRELLLRDKPDMAGWKEDTLTSYVRHQVRAEFQQQLHPPTLDEFLATRAGA